MEKQTRLHLRVARGREEKELEKRNTEIRKRGAGGYAVGCFRSKSTGGKTEVGKYKRARGMRRNGQLEKPTGGAERNKHLCVY